MFKKLFLISLYFLASALLAQNLEEQTEKLTEGAMPPSTSLEAEKANLIEKSGLNLGFVNFRRIMSSLPQIEELREQLNKEFKTQEEDLKKAEQELRELELQNLEKPSDELSQKLIAKRREIVRLESNYRDDYSVRRNEEIAKLQSLIMDEIILMAKEKGFDVILNDSGVLFVSEKADLTQDVIKRLINKH